MYQDCAWELVTARVAGREAGIGENQEFLAYCTAHANSSCARLCQDLWVLWETGGKREGFFVVSRTAETSVTPASSRRAMVGMEYSRSPSVIGTQNSRRIVALASTIVACGRSLGCSCSSLLSLRCQSTRVSKSERSVMFMLPCASDPANRRLSKLSPSMTYCASTMLRRISITCRSIRRVRHFGSAHERRKQLGH